MPNSHLLHHFDLENASSCLPLEREYWQVLKILAYADGWNNWRDVSMRGFRHKKASSLKTASPYTDTG